MFIKTSKKIAQLLKQNKAIDDEYYELCQYGLQQGMSIFLNLLTTILIGIITGMIWQSIIFTILYIPLRSNAGGYHAQTATRCYIYSILLMIAILLAMKYLFIPEFICIIALLISCAIIIILAPVEDLNKPLDDVEQVTYRKRTYIITATEFTFFIISLLLNVKPISLCIMWAFGVMSVILIVGVIKNRTKM